MTLLSDFKKFLLRGNVVDLAVAVIIGTAFTAVVKALVTDIITPLIAAIFGKPSFESLSFTINGSHFLYGDLLNAAFTFLTIAAVVFFLVVAPVELAAGAARSGGPVDQGVPGVHQRDPHQGAPVPGVHVGADGRGVTATACRRTAYSAGVTEITRPRRPVVNCTVPAERA
jgi:large conductance mechanosensitive channel